MMIPLRVGCPIRTSTDQSLLAAPHGFSQRATSFIASWCQGIHRMPLSRSISSLPLTKQTFLHHAQEPSHPKIRSNPAHSSARLYSAQLFNAPEPCRRHRGTILDDLAITAIPSGQTNRHVADGLPVSQLLPLCVSQRPEPHPSCPARPGAHQNLIHNTKEHRAGLTRRRIGISSCPTHSGGAPHTPNWKTSQELSCRI
jgi:hypothetical protein